VSDIVAYQGEVEFDGVFFDDVSGWRVRFRLIGTPGAVDRANPMKKFTKRRGDRAGTRFRAALNPIAFGREFVGDVMLVAWADGTSGWTATFEVDKHPEEFFGSLRRKADRIGTRYMMVLAEIDHDENVVNQKMRERVERAQALGKQARSLSNFAAMLVKNPSFHEWLRETVNAVDWGEESADRWLKHELGIESKADLDDARNSRAIEKYVILRARFDDWNGDSREYH
jgi:hypothetical protein